MGTSETQEATRKVIRAYFDAWTHQRVDEAFALLAADLHFNGPGGSFNSAEAFRPGLQAFAAMTKGARERELIVEGDRAALLYDCDWPEPVGTFRLGSFFRVKSGKITHYDVWFDATKVLPFLAQAAGR
jgi:hypothetical protein